MYLFRFIRAHAHISTRMRRPPQIWTEVTFPWPQYLDLSLMPTTIGEDSRVYTQTHTHTYIYIYILLFTLLFIYLYSFVYKFVYLYVYLYLYIYTQSHTRTYITSYNDVPLPESSSRLKKPGWRISFAGMIAPYCFKGLGCGRVSRLSGFSARKRFPIRTGYKYRKRLRNVALSVTATHSHLCRATMRIHLSTAVAQRCGTVQKTWKSRNPNH